MMRINSLLPATIAALLGALTLTACGGGGSAGGTSGTGTTGSTPPTAAATAGLWKGTINSTSTSQSSTVMALVGTDGHSVWMTTDGRVFDGSMPVTGDHFVAQMTDHMDDSGHFPDGTNFGPGSMTVDSHTSDMMGGHFSGNGDAGTFNMTRSPMWDRPASLGTAAGTYTRTTSNGYAMTMTISANGQLTASDTRGCVVSGTVHVPDAAHNLYSMDATVTSCGSLDGTYHGMGSLLDADAMQDWMTAMHPFEHGGHHMMGGHNTVPTGQHNLFMFSLANDHSAMMDALAR
jgi:hypothetical protein